MPKFPVDWELFYEDKLVEYYKKDEKIASKCKRVGKNCRLTLSERRAYAKEGTVYVCKMIKARLGDISLYQAYQILKEERGKCKYHYLEK